MSRQPAKKLLTLSSPRAFYLAIVAAVVLAVATGFALYVLISHTNADAATNLMRETTKTRADGMEERIAAMEASLQKIAARNDVVATLGAAIENDAALEMLAQKIRDQNSAFTQVDLIPRGKSENFPLSFAELDQVKRTEKGEVTSPEAIMIDGAYIFYVSTPVWNAKRDQIEGTLFVIQNIDRIKEIVSGFDPTYGSTSLVQTFYGLEPRIVFTIGDIAPQLRVTDLAQIGTSHWHILFTPSPEFYKNQGVSPVVLMGILAGLGIVLAIVVIFLLRAARSADLKLYKTMKGPASARKISKNKKDNKAATTTAEDEENETATSSAANDMNEISDPLFQHHDMLDISDTEIEEEPESQPKAPVPAPAAFAPAAMAPAPEPVAPVPAPATSGTINPAIFRDYDIRGDAGLHLPDEVVYSIGQAIGSEAISRGQIRLAVGADGRLSSPRIKEALVNGILATGANVVDIGNVPSPILYFVTETTDIQSGVIVTASHNPASDNGFKIILKGKTLSDDGITALKNRITNKNLSHGKGVLSKNSYTAAYLEKITSDIALSDSLKVVIDCANGIAGEVAPRLLGDLGCEVVPLFCDVDGNFPNHEPDPSVDSNLKALVAKVLAEKADLGIALDGDGDRLVAVSSSGKIVAPDRLLMVFAKDIVSRHPGTDVVFDVKCTRRLNSLISGYGGRPLMWKSGHAHIKAKMKETGAMLGGELSGHIFFKERWYGFDDGLYAAARLLEILTTRGQSFDAVLSTLPVSAITPEIRIPVDEEQKFELIQRLVTRGDFSGGKITTLDGLRVDFSKGWGLIRASNTSACLTLRFEADNDEMLNKIRDMFRKQMKAIIPDVNTNF
jgi:phosphomannomutase/phosphoglucomutase